VAGPGAAGALLAGEAATREHHTNTHPKIMQAPDGMLRFQVWIQLEVTASHPERFPPDGPCSGFGDLHDFMM